MASLNSTTTFFSAERTIIDKKTDSFAVKHKINAVHMT